MAGQGKDVADDGLGLLVDAEGIAGDLTCLEGRVAGEHVAVEILHQKFGRGSIVPVQALFPQFALGIEHRAEHRRREVPQVEDLNGNTGCHASPIGSSQPCAEAEPARGLAKLQNTRVLGSPFRSLCHELRPSAT